MSFFWQIQGHLSNLPKIGCLQKIKYILITVCWEPNIGIWPNVGRWLGYMMVPFFGGCNTLKGVPWPLEKQGTFFSTFTTAKRLLRIHWFDQKSVHRSVLGCSTYLALIYWICHQLTWFLDVKKIKKILTSQILEFWAINLHRYVLICEFTELIFWSGVKAMAIWVIWQKINCSFMPSRVNDSDAMFFGDL